MPDNATATGAVLLGAGFSRRFGADKRLQPLSGGRGVTVAEQTCATYSSVFPHLRVVIRPEDHILRSKLQQFAPDMFIVTCADAHLGMGHSLAAGMQGISWQWAFVGLLDMPFIRAATLQALIDCAAHQQHPAILRPRHTQTGKDGIPFGHPIGWHNIYFAELRACHGDAGAREVLQRHTEEVIEVAVEDAGVLQDIDTPADLHRQV